MVHTKIVQPIGCTLKKMVAHYFLWTLGIPRVLAKSATNATNIRVSLYWCKMRKSGKFRPGKGILQVYRKWLKMVALVAHETL